MGDGDTVFALATGPWTGEADITVIGALAAEAMADAIARAATQATGAAGIPALRDLKTEQPHPLRRGPTACIPRQMNTSLAIARHLSYSVLQFLAWRRHSRSVSIRRRTER